MLEQRLSPEVGAMHLHNCLETLTMKLTTGARAEASRT
jgi:hypothetical protein